jgi:hypothetical protein
LFDLSACVRRIDRIHTDFGQLLLRSERSNKVFHSSA